MQGQVRDLHPFPKPLGPQVRDAGPGPDHYVSYRCSERFLISAACPHRTRLGQGCREVTGKYVGPCALSPDKRPHNGVLEVKLCLPVPEVVQLHPPQTLHAHTLQLYVAKLENANVCVHDCIYVPT